MRTLLCAGLAAGALCAWGVASATTPSAHQGTGITAELAGTWTGHRTIDRSGKTQAIKMVWLEAPDGQMTGTVVVAKQSYPMTVVWSSDTAFIAESAPHRSPLLHEMVVTRAVGHLKGTELVGTLEARPMKFSPAKATSSFEATRA